MENQEERKLKNFMKSDYNDEKLDKNNELNSTMSIENTQEDEYTRVLKNLGGNK